MNADPRRPLTPRNLLMFVGLGAIAMGGLRADGCVLSISRVDSVAFLPDGQRLLVAKLDDRPGNIFLKCFSARCVRTVSILDLADGATRQVVVACDGPSLSRMCGTGDPAIRYAQYSQSAGAFLVSDYRDTVYVIPDREDGPSNPIRLSIRTPEPTTISDDGSLVALVAERKMNIVNIGSQSVETFDLTAPIQSDDGSSFFDAEGAAIAEIPHAIDAALGGRGSCAAVSPNGQWMAVGDYYGRVMLADAATGKVLWSACPPGRTRVHWMHVVLAASGWIMLWRRIGRGN